MTISVQNPINEYVGNGSIKNFSYTFYATSAADIKVYLNGVLQSSGYTVPVVDNQGGGTVNFTTAPANGTLVRVQRLVNLERSTDYQPGASISTDTLDRDFDRLWMAAQDSAVGTLKLDLSGTYNAGNHKIINVTDPTSAQDVATKNWVETALTSPLTIATTQAGIATTKAAEAAASATSASTSASTATTGAGTATTKASEASTSATNAANSAASANNSAIAAANSAAAGVGVVASAEAAADDAALSASTALTYKDNAATSASEASASSAAALISKNSASASATSAANAVVAAEGFRDEAQTIVDDFAASGGVASVNGRTGAVTLAKADVGLSNADNTSDANKPVSTATQTALDLKVNSSLIGANNGVASLDSGGKVPSSQLPSYVDDVLEYANLAAFPGTGAAGVIYIAADTNKTHRWSGSAYVEISASPGSTDAVTEGSTNKYYTDTRVRAAVLTGLSTSTNAAITATDTVLSAAGKLQKQITDHDTSIAAKANTSSLGTVAALSYPGGTTNFLRADGTFAAPPGGGGGTWGSITGTLSSQTDLNTALGLKATVASPTFTGTVTIPSGASISGFATLASPTFTGTPAAPTATAGTNTTQLATTAFVTTADNLKANLAGGAPFTGAVTISSAGSLVVSSKALTAPVSVSFSATPTFNAATSNVFYFGALTANVTSVTISNPTDGQTIQIRFVQDATGSRTVTLPSSVKADGTMLATASRASWLSLTYVSSASQWEGGWTQVPA